MSRPVASIRRATRNGAIRSGSPPGWPNTPPIVAGRRLGRPAAAGRSSPATAQQREVAVGVEGHDGRRRRGDRRRGSTAVSRLARDHVGVGDDQVRRRRRSRCRPGSGRRPRPRPSPPSGRRRRPWPAISPLAAGGGPEVGRRARARRRPAGKSSSPTSDRSACIASGGRGSASSIALGDPRGRWPARRRQPGLAGQHRAAASHTHDEHADDAGHAARRRGRPGRSTPSRGAGRSRPPTTNPSGLAERRARPARQPTAITEHQHVARRPRAGRATAAASADARRARPSAEPDPRHAPG